MRISDWSSDVCSSDLGDRQGQRDRRQRTKARQGTDEGADRDADETEQQVLQTKRRLQPHGQIGQKLHHHCNPIDLRGTRSEERRVGTGCVSKCRSRWSEYPKNKTQQTKIKKKT